MNTFRVAINETSEEGGSVRSSRGVFRSPISCIPHHVSLILGCILVNTTPIRAIITHVPEVITQELNLGKNPEQSAEALNRVLQKEFPDIHEFPFWNNVGKVGNGSGVYLGNGLVLTSAHVKVFPFQMQDGSIYQPDYMSWRVLTNPDGTQSEVALFRVKFSPTSSLSKLASIPIGEASTDTKYPTILLGTGFQRGEAIPPISINNIVIPTNIGGYYFSLERKGNITWSIQRSMKKLTNPVPTEVKTGGGYKFHTNCFTTEFSREAFSGQAEYGDSGGPAFCYNPEKQQWELLGCIIAIQAPELQMDRKPRNLFGDTTFLADLNYYRGEILPEKTPVFKKPCQDNPQR